MRSSRIAVPQGFTLLEMMVTVLIIGIIIGTATAFLRFSPQQQLSRETERLWQLFNLAHDESLARGHVYGWQLSDNTYRFMLFNAQDNRWITITDSPLQSRSFDQQFTLQLDFPAASNFSAESNTKSVAKQANDIPQILFYPNGESTAFRLIINQRDEPLDKDLLSWLDGDGIGRIYLNTPDSRRHE